jgi:ketosteroid isomerase-like protein
MAANADVVRLFFECYLSQDLETAASLMSEDFVFSSPQDDFIDKARYLDVCFPTAGRLRFQELTDLTAIGDDDVFIRYVYELHEGGRYRNSEVITVRDGKLTEVQVFFGAELTDAAPGD